MPKQGPTAARSGDVSSKPSVLRLGAILGAATLLLYIRTASFGFVNYDDTDYVLDNPHVSSGLKFDNVLWAFRESYAANWHPITWVSHMFDCQLFGTNPGPPHIVNAILHSLNSVLLFVLLFRMTGFVARSWFVAVLFGVHPLHVESVAWIAERKDVLSTLFFLLCLLSYARFGEIRANNSGTSRNARNWYGYSLAWFTLGLLSKPMLVTLPFLLLLLDYWPLERLGLWLTKTAIAQSSLQPETKGPQVTIRNLLLEKIPFFTLAAGSSLVTFLAQKSGGAVASLDATPLGERLANAALSYCRYLGKIFWPQNLFIPYVPELDQNAALPWLAGAAILVVTVIALLMRRTCKYLPVGWFWYLGTLAPVIGILQVGSQTMADRYTYIPSIGIFILFTWTCADLFLRWRMQQAISTGLAIAALSGCLVLSFRQIGYWKNGVTFFLHSNAVDPTNLVAVSCLASSYATDPDPNVRDGARAVEAATFCVEQTKRGEPGYLDILSTAYAESGQFRLAVETAQETLRLPATTAQPFFRDQVQKHLDLFKAGRAVRPRSWQPAAPR